jgi:spectrin beta
MFFSRADLVQYEKLSKSNAMFNLNHAFNLAEKEFGLVKLLDAGQFLDHYY